MAKEEQLQDCWDSALRAFGTADIFKQRYIKAQRKLRLLAFFGIIVPVSVGGIIGAFFGIEAVQKYLGILIIIAGLLSTVQLSITVWSLLAKWEDSAVYGLESSGDNYEISRQFEDLAKAPLDDFDRKYELLNQRNDLRSREDEKKGITEPEKRRGMRVALRRFKRECLKCKEIPYDLTPTDCPVCGRYGIAFKLKKLFRINQKLLKSGEKENER